MLRDVVVFAARRSLAGVIFLLLAVPLGGSPVDAQINTDARSRLHIRGLDFSSNVVNVRKVIRGVFRITVESDGAGRGGTGFLISGTRIVATNNHVVDNGRSFELGFVDEYGQPHCIPAKLLAQYPQKDLALLEAASDLPGEALPLANAAPDPGGSFYTIGFPVVAHPEVSCSISSRDQNTPSVLKGIVSKVVDQPWSATQLHLQTPLIPGYSGGPLVDDKTGAVIGVSTAVHKEAPEFSFAVLSTDLIAFANACSIAVNGAVKPVDVSWVTSLARQTSGKYHQELQRAYGYLDNGDIAAARLLFEHLSQLGSPEAAFGMGQSYDQNFLRGMGVVGLSGDPAQAQAWYEKASELGSVEARRLLFTLAGGCNNSLCSIATVADGHARVSCGAGDSTRRSGG